METKHKPLEKGELTYAQIKLWLSKKAVEEIAKKHDIEPSKVRRVITGRLRIPEVYADVIAHVIKIREAVRDNLYQLKKVNDEIEQAKKAQA